MLNFIVVKIKKRIADIFVNSPIGYRFAKGAFWSFTGSLISRGLQLVSFIIIARILGKVTFGELSIIQSTIGLFGALAGFGLGLTATKFIAEFRNTDREKAGRIRALTSAISWVTTLLTAILLLLLAPIIADKFLAAPQLEGLFRISTIYLFFTSVNSAQNGILAGFEAFKNIARINLINGLLSFPIMLCLAFLWKLEGAVYGLVITSFLLWLITHISIRRECRINNISYSYKNMWLEKEIIIRFSLPTVLSSLVVGPVMWFANTLLVNQVNGYAEFGFYSAIQKIKQVPELILMTLLAPLLPILSEQYGQKNIFKFNKTLQFAFNISLIIIMPISLIQIASPSVTTIPFGKDFTGNDSTIQWLMLHSIFLSLFYPFGSILASTNRMWFGLIYNLLFGIILLIMSYFLIPTWAATGLAASTTLSYVLTSIVTIIYIYYYEKELIINSEVIKNILTVFILIVIAYLLYLFLEDNLSLILSIFIVSLFIYIKIKNNRKWVV